MIPFTITPRGVSFIIEGKPKNILRDHGNYEAIIKAIKEYDIDELKALCDLKSFVSIASNGFVEISDDEVRFKGTKVNDYLAERILYHHKNNLPIEPLCNFTERLMSNPTIDVRDDLFKWIENGDMPVCSNGNFIAYKVVQANFKPVHVGPYGQDQSVGKTVTMPREKCNSNRDDTCAEGLHFCSWEYVPTFGGASGNRVVIILEIDPKDVVAIPTDYNLSKGRCCKFKVIGVTDTYKDELKGTGIYIAEEPDYAESSGLEFYHKATNATWTEDILQVLKHGDGESDGSTYKEIAEITGVPKGTLEGWYKKIREAT